MDHRVIIGDLFRFRQFGIMDMGQALDHLIAGYCSGDAHVRSTFERAQNLETLMDDFRETVRHVRRNLEVAHTIEQRRHFSSDILDAYRAGTLDPEHYALVEEHLAQCSFCRGERGD